MTTTILSQKSEFDSWKLQVRQRLNEAKLDKLVLNPDKNCFNYAQKDQEARTILLSSIHPKLSSMVSHCQTAAQMWNVLHNNLQNLPQTKELNDLYERFINYKYKEGMDLVSYVRKGKDLGYACRRKNFDVSNEKIKFVLLKGLEAKLDANEYSIFLSLCKQTKSLDQFSELLKEKWMPFKNSKLTILNQMLAPKDTQSNLLEASLGAFKPSIASSVPSTSASLKQSNENGKEVSNQPSINKSVLAIFDTKKMSDSWVGIISSRHHLTHNRKLLTDYKSLKFGDEKVFLCNDYFLNVFGKGDLKVTDKNGQKHVFFDVYYVPDAKRNLLSIPKCIADGYNVMMNDKILTLSLGMEKTLTASLTDNYFYMFDFEPVSTEVVQNRPLAYNKTYTNYNSNSTEYNRAKSKKKPNGFFDLLKDLIS